MIDIGKWAQPQGPIRTEPYPDPVTIGLGIDQKNAAAGLREIADRIDRGEIGICVVQLGQRLEANQYASCALFIEFEHYRRVEGERKPPERVVNLPDGA